MSNEDSTELDAPQLLERITAALSYLRIGQTSDSDSEWIRSEELIINSEPGQLLEVVRETGRGRGIDRDDIALSLFLQAYGFRIASAAIAGWILTDGNHYLDVDVANTSIALGRHRPNAVGLDNLGLGVGSIHASLFDGHLTPMVHAAHEAINAAGDSRVGMKMLWGNIGAGVASTFGVFSAIVEQDPTKASAVPDAAAVRSLAERFMADAPPDIQTSGQFVLFQGERPEPVWAWERTSCCLWYQVPPADPSQDPFKCTDCSLWSQQERTARYVAATGVES